MENFQASKDTSVHMPVQHIGGGPCAHTPCTRLADRGCNLCDLCAQNDWDQWPELEECDCCLRDESDDDDSDNNDAK